MISGEVKRYIQDLLQKYPPEQQSHERTNSSSPLKYIATGNDSQVYSLRIPDGEALVLHLYNPNFELETIRRYGRVMQLVSGIALNENWTLRCPKGITRIRVITFRDIFESNIQNSLRILGVKDYLDGQHDEYLRQMIIRLLLQNRQIRRNHIAGISPISKINIKYDPQNGLATITDLCDSIHRLKCRL